MTHAVTSLVVVAAAMLVPAGALPAQASGTAGSVPDPRTPYFTVESTRSVGNQGEERLDVSVDAACGQPALLFDHAELVVQRNRFGDVQFVGLPQPGCARCAPVTLRWFHEPTGYLSFHVNVYRRWEVVPCLDEALEADRR